MIDAFIAATEHPQLSQRSVAREVVFVLVHHRRVTPPILQRMAGQLGLPRSYEAGDMLARMMEADGWICASAVSFVGKGTSAVSAYAPTRKWEALVEGVT